MTREDYLSIAASKYDELQSLNKIDNFYDYEKRFDEIFTDLGRKVLESNISSSSADRRKKKHLQNLGTLK